MRQFSFQKLEVYQLGRKLVQEIYMISARFPETEKFGLTNQMRRAAVSICLNLAEGSGRFSNKEKIRFIEIAFGSLLGCTDIALDLGFLTSQEKDALHVHLIELSNKINALKKHFQAQITN